MLTLVGEDKPGIVAALTDALYVGGCNLGEASMMRLGGNFTMMLMVQCDKSQAEIEGMVQPVASEMGCRVHVDAIQGRLHQHMEPDVRVVVHGADQAGIVARVTRVLAEAGMNIIDLETDVGGSENKPLYMMLIEGHASRGIEALEEALQAMELGSLQVTISPINTLVG
jgi:glycine cleavage system transcriptional repressor